MRSSYLKAILTLGTSFLTCGIAHAGSHTSSLGGTYSVELNKTEIVYLPQAAGAVVIGNPAIADVSIHSSDTIFVIGRGYGETNLLVLDGAGRTMMNADIQVTNTLPAHGVRLYNGSLRQTYSCTPYCQPSPILGDGREFISENSGEGEPINSSTSIATPRNSFSAGPPPSGSSQSSPPQSFSPPPPNF